MKKTQWLKQLIAEEVFVLNTEEQIGISDDPETWLFDFRRVLLSGEVADTVANLFCEQFVDQYPFQIGTLEVAGIPLATTLMNKLYAKGHTDINAFFIRKSRKKTDLLKMVEGTILKDIPILLVDDTMNRGNTFWRQLMVLDELGYNVDTVWSILRYRDQEYYDRFTRRGITVQSLFELDDFSAVLGDNIHNLVAMTPCPTPMPFTAEWVFSGAKPSLLYVVPKSQPVLDEKHIYVGADDQAFRALDQSDGSVAWEFTIGSTRAKKAVFSSPALHQNTVIFGAYDGNVYCLNKETGEIVWRFMEADWVGSSPCVAADLGIVFIGLEFGLIRKRGGIVALNLATGERVWADYSHPALTHSSPLYITEQQQVVIGSNDGVVRLYDATTGVQLWSFTTFGGADYVAERDGGYSGGDIKESFAYDPKRDLIIFGSQDGFLYIVDRKTGYLVHHYKCRFEVRHTPTIYNGRVYFASADKHLRAINLDDFSLQFEKNVDDTRIFSRVAAINDRLYLGTNAARLHELDPETGEQLSYFQATERITNHLVYNAATNRYFLPTYANQIICLKREQES
ncbi:MAG: PQQ-binding-like beta-propeller repeat protein [Patescibacteria group bacterium]